MHTFALQNFSFEMQPLGGAQESLYLISTEHHLRDLLFNLRKFVLGVDLHALGVTMLLRILCRIHAHHHHGSASEGDPGILQLPR